MQQMPGKTDPIDFHFYTSTSVSNFNNKFHITLTRTIIVDEKQQLQAKHKTDTHKGE